MVVHARGGNFAEGLRLDSSKLAVDLDALSEKSEHVVPNSLHWLSGFHPCLPFNVFQEWSYMFQPALSLCCWEVYRELATSKVVSQRRRRVEDQAAVGYEVPPFLHILDFAHEFEVTDVDREDQLQLPMVE